MRKILNAPRRRLLTAAAAAAFAPMARQLPAAESSATVYKFGSGTLRILSDGHLRFPVRYPENDAQQASSMKKLLGAAGFSVEQHQPPCNVTLWDDGQRLVLFDIGSGQQFMDTAGTLPLQLEAIGVDPADVTDVVFTHAHPDHCWGLIDDFDELFCPNAVYHMHQGEFDYWMSEQTLNQADDAGLSMVAGARNRLPLIESQLEFFSWGDEILPGIEAVDTHGHTPGHTSFTIHQANESLLVAGDALTHPILSFQRPLWYQPNDTDAETAAQTRSRLLDRLSSERTLMVAYHLPNAGFGRVEQLENHYRFVPQL
jgi:glyoxylase-like metal-dependent hydrolase (beta-lactamase superfamily II)